MPVLYRSDQAAVHLQVDGVALDNVVWDTMEGGDASSDGVNYLPGGMVPSVELGGIPKRSDLTLTRVWSDALWQVFKALDNACGRAGAKASYTQLDRSGQVVPGSTITYTGIVKSVARPNYDSNTSGEAKIQVVIGLNGSIT